MWVWIFGMPVLWLRRALCKIGLHDDGFDFMGGCSTTCLRCGKQLWEVAP